MMPNQANLFDRRAVTQKRDRARRLGPALFLHQEAASEIKERLELINKSFTEPVIVTGWPEVWGSDFPGATLVSDEDVLPLAENAHDLIIHAMSLHSANDPVGQIIQCHRALKPDGLFLGVLFGGQTLFQLRAVLAEAEARVTGGLSPRVSPMPEIRDLGALLQRAGLALPVADAIDLKVTYADAFALMRDLRAMGETNSLSDRSRRFTKRAILFEAATEYANSFPADDGRIEVTFDMVFLSGWAPDESQPKPLRPGSAQARLADILDTTETKLGSND